MKEEKSQQEIHKIDMSGKSGPPEAQFDIFLSDILEASRLIGEEENGSIKNQRIAMLAEYIRGCRDGFRMMRKNPHN